METRRCASSRLRSFPLTHAVWAEELGLLLLVSALAPIGAWLGFAALGCSLFSEPGSGAGLAVSPPNRLRLLTPGVCSSPWSI